MLSLVNNDINCPATSGAVWEAREVNSLPFKARLLQEPRRDFTTQLEEWMRKDSAVRMQSCFRGRRVRRVRRWKRCDESSPQFELDHASSGSIEPLRPPELEASPPPPPSGSPSEPADSTAEVRALDGLTLILTLTLTLTSHPNPNP